jgi:hypothetical protein
MLRSYMCLLRRWTFDRLSLPHVDVTCSYARKKGGKGGRVGYSSSTVVDLLGKHSQSSLLKTGPKISCNASEETGRLQSMSFQISIVLLERPFIHARNRWPPFSFLFFSFNSHTPKAVPSRLIPLRFRIQICLNQSAVGHHPNYRCARQLISVS